MGQLSPAPARVAAALVEGAQCMQDFEFVLLECLASELSQQRSLRGDAVVWVVPLKKGRASAGSRRKVAVGGRKPSRRCG